MAGEIDPKALIDTSDMVRVDSATPPSVSLNPTGDPEFSSLSLAPIPPVMGTDTDAARQFYRPGVSQIRMPPLPVQSKIAAGASAQSQVINQQIVSSGGPDLQVNNVDNPVQNILNITGSGVSYGPGKGQVQISSGGSSSAIAGPGFISLPGITTTNNVALTNCINGANGVGGILFYLPTTITTGHIIFNVNVPDATNSYDVGIYGPFTGVETSLPLIVNVGATIFASPGSVTTPWLQSATTIEAGYYFLLFTTSASIAVTLSLDGMAAMPYLYDSQTVSVSSGSVLPATVTPPPANPTYSYSGIGPNKPQYIQFLLVP